MWLLPANWLLDVKRWRRRRVTHNTTLSHNISSHAHPSTSTCFRVSAGCQTAGWLTSRAGVYGGWVVAAAIDLWSASFSSWGGATLPAAACASFWEANTISAATRSPAVSGKHNRGETAATPTGETVDEEDEDSA